MWRGHFSHYGCVFYTLFSSCSSWPLRTDWICGKADKENHSLFYYRKISFSAHLPTAWSLSICRHIVQVSFYDMVSMVGNFSAPWTRTPDYLRPVRCSASPRRCCRSDRTPSCPCRRSTSAQSWRSHLEKTPNSVRHERNEPIQLITYLQIN